MNNKELQNVLQQYPDDAEVYFNCLFRFGKEECLRNMHCIQVPVGRVKHDNPDIVLLDEY